nr:MAG TPA: hypothetical protein [Caudoviricetes sp.]
MSDFPDLLRQAQLIYCWYLCEKIKFLSYDRDDLILIK